MRKFLVFCEVEHTQVGVPLIIKKLSAAAESLITYSLFTITFYLSFTICPYSNTSKPSLSYSATALSFSGSTSSL